MNITDNLQEDKYVAFLDVLGFKELVRAKGKKLNKYFDTVQNALGDIRDDKPKIKSRLISDSIILSCDVNTEDFRLLLTAVQTIQSRCALENIWIRGAITIGDIHFNDFPNIVVGNGLTNAYLLESQAQFPRVIIDPKIIKDRFNNREEFILEYNSSINGDTYAYNRIPLIHDIRERSLFIDTDSFFVAFMERIAVEDFNNLEIIYAHIKNELYSGQENYKKYFWLKNYFTEALIGFVKYRSENVNSTNSRLKWIEKFRLL